MGRLAEHYLAHRNGRGAAPEEELFGSFLDAGRLAWPGIAISDEELVAHLARHCPSLPDPALRGADLYLACGCTLGNPAALAAFEAGYLAQVPSYLARSGTARDAGEEVRQLLGHRLLVGSPGRIADYQGRGSLLSWVRAAAARTALNLARGERRHRQATAAAAGDSVMVAGDPELDFIKARFRPQFKQAFRAALAQLPSRERAVLRLHYAEHVGVGQIAASYGVHRATVSRWLHDAQRAVLDETRLRLAEALKIGQAECDQLVGLVQSRLDVTLSSLLRSTP